MRLVLPLVLLLLPATLAAQTTRQIDDSLAKAKSFLYSRQADGNWESAPNRDLQAADGGSVRGAQWGGTTALATYALLASGEKPTDPRLAPAIDFLKKSELVGTYAIALRCMVALHLPRDESVRAMVRKDADALLQGVKKDRPGRGFYDYTDTGRLPTFSLSRGQYGVLGVWAAGQCGVDIPGDYWRLVEEAWTKAQFPSGAWNYGEAANFPPTVGMTAAGAATLYLIGDAQHARDAATRGNATNPVIDKALKYLAANIDKFASKDRHARDFPFASLYSLERIGMASGLKYFKGVDWYRHGATWLLANQAPEGFWDSSDPNFGSIVDTSFAVLFLARGRAPLAFTKLDYSEPKRPAQGWNQRPRDIANLTAYLGRQLERDLGWQTLDLQSATDADLHDAPILYLAGSQALNFTSQSAERLRAFCQKGGLIVGHADGSSNAFAAGFRKLAVELFPSYPWRDLPPSHPIYSILYKRGQWKTTPDLAGLSNGARELLILLPPNADFARSWQTQSTTKEEQWQLPVNLLLYATDHARLRVRGDTRLIEADPKIAARRTISVLRIQYDGNWDPEPAAWPRVAAHLHNAESIDLKIVPSKLDQKLPIQGSAIAHLTGTTAFQLTPEARRNLKDFIEAGHVLLIDAAGSSPEFAAAVEVEIKNLAAVPLVPLPHDHPIYTLNGHTIPQPLFRPATVRQIGLLKSPRLQSAGPTILYSRDDLSTALIGREIAIPGYTPDAALAIVTNIVLTVK